MKQEDSSSYLRKMNKDELFIELKDNEWEYIKTTHDRNIVRAIVIDDDGYFYFLRLNRNDAFGKSFIIETSGGGVEDGEDLISALIRELKEELGAEVEVISKIGVVSDYYNLIYRHNINNYYLCKVLRFGDTHQTQEEIEDFHLKTIRLSYVDALKEYENNKKCPLGRLITNRELPILKHAKMMLNK